MVQACAPVLLAAHATLSTTRQVQLSHDTWQMGAMEHQAAMDSNATILITCSKLSYLPEPSQIIIILWLVEAAVALSEQVVLAMLSHVVAVL